jgi:nicotinamide-nucleotide amidase
MTRLARGSEDAADLAASISRAVGPTRRTVSVAESLTSGRLAAELGAAEASSDWFSGGVIAYTNDIKYKVLGVDPGPVVTASCAQQMARGVADLTGSDLAVATTGVGGPGPVEGQPAGTVFIAVSWAAGEQVEEHHFPGEPWDVVQATTWHALRMLLAVAEQPAASS